MPSAKAVPRSCRLVDYGTYTRPRPVLSRSSPPFCDQNNRHLELKPCNRVVRRCHCVDDRDHGEKKTKSNITPDPGGHGAPSYAGILHWDQAAIAYCLLGLHVSTSENVYVVYPTLLVHLFTLL